ncbi:MAG: hypothetical protein AB7G62_01775 [Magnetospirillum sp.]
MNAPDDGARLAVVRFCAGGHEFALEARCVRAMRLNAEPRSCRIEDVLGLPAQPGAARRWLLLDLGGDADFCLDVAEPVALAQLPAEDVRLLPPLVVARTTLPALAAMVLDDAGHGVLLLDARRLFSPPPR